MKNNNYLSLSNQNPNHIIESRTLHIQFVKNRVSFNRDDGFQNSRNSEIHLCEDEISYAIFKKKYSRK